MARATDCSRLVWGLPLYFSRRPVCSVPPMGSGNLPEAIRNGPRLNLWLPTEISLVHSTMVWSSTVPSPSAKLFSLVQKAASCSACQATILLSWASAPAAPVWWASGWCFSVDPSQSNTCPWLIHCNPETRVMSQANAIADSSMFSLPMAWYSVDDIGAAGLVQPMAAAPGVLVALLSSVSTWRMDPRCFSSRWRSPPPRLIETLRYCSMAASRMLFLRARSRARSAVALGSTAPPPPPAGGVKPVNSRSKFFFGSGSGKCTCFAPSWRKW